MKLTTKLAREILEYWYNDYNKTNQSVVFADTMKPATMVAKAFKMGADALALQEPKKPREDTFGWYCPICNHYFDPRAWKSAYCGQCGNKLDWSDN